MNNQAFRSKVYLLSTAEQSAQNEMLHGRDHKVPDSFEPNLTLQNKEVALSDLT